MANTLFEKYGGFAAISRIVMAFYDRCLESDVVGPYFEHTNMAQLVDHQTKFISALLGGPASYSNEQLRKVHAPHIIDPAAFEEMARLLRGTLEDFEMEAADIALVMEEIQARAVYVVTDKSS